MDDINSWLEETRSRCVRFSEAYRIQLGGLWWANLALVVLPAVFSTAAAIIAAIPAARPDEVAAAAVTAAWWHLPPASILAGSAAILVAVHKALKCEEYQAECLRLMQRYQGLAEEAASARSRPEAKRPELQEKIADELKQLTDSAGARLPTRILRRANSRYADSKLFWRPAAGNPAGKGG